MIGLPFDRSTKETYECMRRHLSALEHYRLDEKIASLLGITDARAVLLNLFKQSCTEEDLEDTIMMPEATVGFSEQDADSSEVLAVP